MSDQLIPYIVLYTNEDFPNPEASMFQAENAEHAKEQFHNEDPTGKLVWVGPANTEEAAKAIEYYQMKKEPAAPLVGESMCGPLVSYGTLKPIRSESTQPCVFRYARYPNGDLRVQGGYMWHEGWSGGIVWRDLPIVDVDDDGNELIKSG